ncbi:MAG: methionyl-tRNA formyltransferase [Bacteroidota bacterium]|nr:methionyl-tRNA formyltransferase [Bacteroidota bacterium]
MKIVFMGTPEFAVPCLHILLKNNYNIVGVITVPDKPAGRGQQINQSAIKKYALEHDLKLLQPEKLKDETFITELKSLNADLQIVVAFRMLPEIVWNMPKLGTYNLHASLLPKYRGASPINWAIINGDTESGVTTFKLKHEIDTGNILFQEKVQILNTTTAGELHDNLMEVGSKLVLKTVQQIEQSFQSNTALEFIPQQDVEASHAPKLFKETCKLNWNESVIFIYNLIRGLSPYPTAFAELDNKDNKIQLVKFYAATFEETQHQQPNGLILSDNKTHLKVYCKNGILTVCNLQLQGKKQMNVEEFLRGFKFNPEAKFM